MTCPTCGNAHSGECSVAALKARIAALETEASEAAMAAAVGEAVVATLRGEEVSDFMQSFGPVMEAQTVAHTNALLHGDVEAQRRVIVDACAHLRVTDDDEADWPKLPGAVLQLMEDHEAHRRQMAIALRLPEASTWAEMVAATSWDEATKLRGMVRDVLASLDRLTALLAAETERALKMEGERDEAISDREREVRRQNDAHGTLDKILNCPDCHGHGEIDTRHMVAGPHGEPEECGGVWRCDACEGTGIGDVAVLVKERDTLRAQLAALHAKADPRIADLAAKVRAGNGTAEDLAVLCDAAGRAALLEALAAGKDEALAEADATITRLNRGAH